MPTLLVLIIFGVLLAFIGYLSLQLYINRRILDAFQRAAIVIPTSPEQGSGLKSGLLMFGFILAMGFVAMFLAR
jgi:hypothetical protein